LATLLGVAWLAYAPGLAGGFLFDDFVNLDALGATGPVDDWPTFWRYITSGVADPLGRPLSLLSFLVDARDWPADPAPLLRTNLLIHLTNGALLFALLRQLERAISSAARHSDWVALLAAAAWLLHPLFVSTTLYIVQREAMLPATFTLLGLLGYCHGRQRFDAGSLRVGTAWMVGAIGAGTVLSMLCKANGLLLPLLAWILDAGIYQGKGNAVASRPLRTIRWALLILPSVAVAAYLATQLPQLTTVPVGRSWTIAQRALTEGRVLLDYLALLVAPRVISTGLYNDAYVASTGIFQPWQTLPALAAVGGLLWLAIASRARWPRLSIALLFFLGGHVLESTVIPLELYFEHRNYLPAMLLAWPVAAACLQPSPRRWRLVGYALWLGLLWFVLWQRAGLWGQQDTMYAVWAKANPDSPRAIATAAMVDAGNGKAAKARANLDLAWRRRPDELQLGLNYVDAACRLDGLHPAEIARVDRMLAITRRGDSLLAKWLSGAIDTAEARACPGLALPVVERWAAIATQNRTLGSPAQRSKLLEPLFAKIDLARGRPASALRHFDAALVAAPAPDLAAGQAAMLAAAGYYDFASRHLDLYDALPKRATSAPGMPTVHAWVLERQGYWNFELADLRRRIQAARREAPP
jgi:hypothetical protein